MKNYIQDNCPEKLSYDNYVGQLMVHGERWGSTSLGS